MEKLSIGIKLNESTEDAIIQLYKKFLIGSTDQEKALDVYISFCKRMLKDEQRAKILMKLQKTLTDTRKSIQTIMKKSAGE